VMKAAPPPEMVLVVLWCCLCGGRECGDGGCLCFESGDGEFGSRGMSCLEL
jgi:hypothetical protein